MTQPTEGQRPEKREESVKETLISIIISFALAFVARSYVAEPFVIPTGSMAPTLNGAHMRFHSPASGYQWAANPADYDRRSQEPLPIQGSRAIGFDPVRVTDPMTGWEWSEADLRTRAGDRILVQKYLYAINPPKRWDVVVFKNPEAPATNFIKRLVGLPNERVALIDGDVFTRPTNGDGSAKGDWQIQRKPDRVQRAVWAPLFSSEYTPHQPTATGRWTGPWRGEGWNTEGSAYRHDGAAPGALRWSHDEWRITDSVPYNWTAPIRPPRVFPVSDLRLRAGVEPGAGDLTIEARLDARAHEFEARIAGGVAAIRMRAAESETADTPAPEWRTLASAEGVDLPPGRITDIEFWHVDQRLALFIDGERILEATYDWSPLDRVRNATVRGSLAGANLADPDIYRRPEVRWVVSGAPVTLHRVGLDRDLHYQTTGGPGNYNRAATLDGAVALDPDQFFMLGDNSPASRDGRAWERVDPWVAAALDDTVGVVNRDLMMGRAFFVYFPAPHTNLRGIPVPDIGRLRFIH
jgi:signal peptidase I